MSMETFSPSRNRVYRWKFDHDLAQELRGQGWTYGALAERFGVSVNAVARVCDPRVREAMKESNRRYQTSGVCPDCGKTGTTRRPNGDRRCIPCRARADAKVQDGRAFCPRCGTWKPEGEFCRSNNRPARGLRGECRACDTERRREYRHRHAEAQRAYDREYKRRRKAAA